MSEGTFVTVAQLQDIPQGKTLVVNHLDAEVLLCHTREGLFAVANLCSHAAERLCGGKLKGHRILCPLHGAAFDVRDGSALSRPAIRPIATYAVRVEEGAVLLGAVSEPD